ncbi:MAG: fumarate reductase cytochrome b subunit [Candidatus Competibacteraceae bacterium]
MQPVKAGLPARLDFLQSVSGLFLALFMWLHMVFVSSILLGKDAMYTVARMFEGQYIFGQPYPGLVSLVVAVVFFIFIAHAGLALRKFPINYRQYKLFRGHMKMMQHEDTSLWFVQVYTGFAMFFLGSVHLYIMLTIPIKLAPMPRRIAWSGLMWLYISCCCWRWNSMGGIGLYRLAVKWGWLEGKNPNETRKKLKKAKWGLTIFFLTLGFLSLAAYIKIGVEHSDRVGERYVPAGIEQQQH